MERRDEMIRVVLECVGREQRLCVISEDGSKLCRKVDETLILFFIETLLNSSG